MNRSSLPVFVLPLLAAACSAGVGTSHAPAPLTSNETKFLDFEFDGEVVGTSDDSADKLIHAQLFYTIGALTTFNANSRAGQLQPTDVRETALDGGKKKVNYHARLAVGWPKDKAAVATYSLAVPVAANAAALSAFNDAYDGKCGTNEYGRDTFWHDFNPAATGCTLGTDVIRFAATVSDHQETGAKYPEYDRIWADRVLKAVYIGGANENTTSSDISYGDLQKFVDGLKADYPNAVVTENATSDSIARDVTVTAKIGDADDAPRIEFTGLFVGTLYQVGDDFDRRYAALTADADFISYNGHSELSQNTTAFGNKGTVTAGKYQIALVDSCDSFAYLKNDLQARRAAANTDDPNGTKYLDVISNLLPSYFWSGNSALEVFRVLADAAHPKTFSQLLEKIPAVQVAIVSGEEDNTYDGTTPAIPAAPAAQAPADTEATPSDVAPSDDGS